MINKALLAFACSIVILSSCKKEKSEDPNPPVGNIDKVKDSALAIAREAYLWYSQIPSSFNAQNYADPNKIMEAIRQYSIEPGFTNPVDRWSFAITSAEWNDVSGGVGKDFGFSVFFYAEGDLRVKYVEKSSPAAAAGIRRGWRITKINGNTNVTTGNANYIVNAIFESTSGSFTFTKPDGGSVDLALTAATYQGDPFLLDTVYTAGASKAGYIVFNSFLGDTTAIYNRMQSIFTRFATAGVNDVIIDLRYNGGGYVSVQQKFANYLINNAGNGQVMMKQQFNDKLGQFYNSTTNFSKLGTINLSRVFFIVSNNTASASELLINNLKPFMDVKIVGPSNSYGKPVGYFPITVGTWEVLPVSFRSTNKNNEGNYFNGFAPNKQVADGLNKDWGDKDESALSSILKFLETGAFGLAEIPGVMNKSTTKEVLNVNEKIEAKAFKGMVDSRRF